MIQDGIPEGLTFDDVLLEPSRSEVLPAEVDTRTCLTRNIGLHIPIVSSAMDTVTESHLAIALAQQVGTTLEEAEAILHEHRVEKLLVVDDQYILKGLITVKDIQKKLKYPNAAKDSQGRLRVGAAVGATGDFLERAQELVRRKVDVLAIDTAHGHSARVMEAVRTIKRKLPDVQLITGNVATYEGAKELISLGVDGIKVGIGP